jgi:hypothetical protein
MTIYLDTNIWNALCDQAIDPARLAATLAARDTRLVLSYHTVYELLKTFRGSGHQAALRGAKLCSCLSDHLVGEHITCVHEILELLGFEMGAIVRQTSPPDPFVSKPVLMEMISEVRKLATGHFSAQAEAFVNERARLSSTARSDQKSHIEARADMKEKLRTISADKLGAWLAASTAIATPTAVSLLAEKIRYRFAEASLIDSLRYSSALLESPAFRTPGALVRADLYFNWRCAHRGSNPKDLYDDMYHVMGAIYCDAYVTKEPAQAEYAHLLLTPNTSVHIYKPETPVDQWLESLTPKQPPIAA